MTSLQGLSLLVHHDATAFAGGAVAVLAELRIFRELAHANKVSLLVDTSSPKDFVEEARSYVDEVIAYDAGPLKSSAWRYLGVPILERMGLYMTRRRVQKILTRVARLISSYRVVHVHFSHLEPLLPELLGNNKPVFIKTVHDALYVCPLRSTPGTWLGLRCSGVWRDSSCYLDGLQLGLKYLARVPRNLARLRKLVGVISELYDAVIVPSKFLAEMMSPIPLRVKVIRNPAPLEAWRFREKINHGGYGKHTDYVLFLGRLSPEKGVRYLELVADKLKGLGIKLYVAGKGPLAEYLKKLQNKFNNIRFLGFVKGIEKYMLIFRARALLFPSVVAENMPMSIVEALTLGTPVVAYNLGGQAELVRESGGGFLVRPFDGEEFSETVISILDPKEEHEKSINAYDWAGVNLSPGTYAAKIMELLAGLV